MKKVLFLLFPLILNGQSNPIGYWKDYLSYHHPQFLTEIGDNIYCVTQEGLFFFNKEESSINRISKVTGLSDIDVVKVGYHNATKSIILFYKNTNIDIIKNNIIINIPDLKQAVVSGQKTINNFVFRNNFAYLSCSFGVVVLDMVKMEIVDVYGISSPSSNNIIYETAFLKDSIYVASEKGIYSSNINNLFLSDFNQWTKHLNFTGTTSPNASFTGIINVDENLISQTSSNSFYLYNINTWTSIISANYLNPKLIANDDLFFVVDSNKVFVYNLFFEIENLFTGFSDVEYAIKDDQGVFWIAEKPCGILKYTLGGNTDTILPISPVSTDIYSLTYLNNNLYVAHGGHVKFNYLGNKNGVSIMDEFNIWKNYNYYDLNKSRDILNSASFNDKAFFACWGDGIVVLKNGVYFITYDHENTNGALDTISWRQTNNKIRVSDIKFDKLGNLWGLSSEVEHPLFVMTNSGAWHSFSMNLLSQKLYFSDLIIDQANQKWGVIGNGGGLFVYNDNGTISNETDDEYKILNTNIGNGNLHTTNIYCLAEDLNGQIWVGTDKGICVFYSPNLVFSNYNFDAQQILIQEGDYGQYLLSTEKIQCIAIDGANRKWIGTANSGVYLFSEDGTQEIHHFTIENSPLFSNNIIDLTINNNNGEVFIGTDQGLISYISDAIIPSEHQENITIYPNPVRETYYGPIIMDGLVSNSNIKITDITGNLIFQTLSKGGRVTWNGLDQNSLRVTTGVYLVFCSDLNGEEKIVGKILFIQ